MTTLVIEHLNASELPPLWAQRMQVKPGQTVTVRIETEVDAAKTNEASAFVTDDPAFGIWRDFDATNDVADFARGLRSSRYNRDGSRSEC